MFAIADSPRGAILSAMSLTKSHPTSGLIKAGLPVIFKIPGLPAHLMPYLAPISVHRISSRTDLECVAPLSGPGFQLAVYEYQESLVNNVR